ncbi:MULTISPECIES: hypothetical protein [unclassified Rheinheimera]|uniref:hypothetical protein n=1 Tax=unclassified Rheinheimera TaxID=115860 RepID=UPI0010522DE6|nr:MULTISPECIES: hypothetical protein [unclassified Rheinheimera]QBL10376.1 hypothetical protein E0Z06_12990 [Rheinheimera sp. D18]WNO59766.1 hypothetical protein RDV63_02050 [Rheinheimera sp. MMS21-TC3]
MQELTFEQVEEVNGAFGVPGMGLGAVIGAAGYLGSAATSGSFSWGGLAAATGTGAASGAIGGPIGSAAARYLLPRVAALGGAATGAQ